jgi:xylan 1,4-beta-xylosidase
MRFLRNCAAVITACLMLLSLLCPAHADTTQMRILLPAARDANTPGGLPLRELMDVPMRDPNVTRGPDGDYYLVGTTDPAPGYTTIGANDPSGQMWTINDGIRMWKSPDMVHWKSLGLIWSIDRDGAGTWVHWWPAGTPNPGTAIWAPEIHYLKGTYWIPYCTKLQGPGLRLACGLLRSTSGRPEGPYREVQPAAPLGDSDDASLFQDTDGTVYYLFDGEKIARMRPDMSGLAEPVRDITFAQPPGWGEGVFLVKVNGKYIFINSGTASFDPQGKGTGSQHTTYDCFSAVSGGSIYGPYTARYRAIPHDGHNNLFQDGRGRWWATYFGSDPFAPFAIGASGRPCVMPVTISPDGRVRFARTASRPVWRYVTQSPPGDWTATGYDAAHWKVGGGAFGDPVITQHGQVTDIGTTWTAGDIWLRKTFTVTKAIRNPSIFLRHDGPIQVFLNGREVLNDPGTTDDYVTAALNAPMALQRGMNTLAVHCASSAGAPAYVDVGLVETP